METIQSNHVSDADEYDHDDFEEDDDAAFSHKSQASNYDDAEVEKSRADSPINDHQSVREDPPSPSYTYDESDSDHHNQEDYDQQKEGMTNNWARFNLHNC